MARTIACVGFIYVVTTRPFLAMHPEGSGCIDAPLVAAGWMPYFSCGRDKKAGVRGKGPAFPTSPKSRKGLLYRS